MKPFMDKNFLPAVWMNTTSPGKLQTKKNF